MRRNFSYINIKNIWSRYFDLQRYTLADRGAVYDHFAQNVNFSLDNRVKLKW